MRAPFPMGGQLEMDAQAPSRLSEVVKRSPHWREEFQKLVQEVEQKSRK
jgi:hypothetical protein